MSIFADLKSVLQIKPLTSTSFASASIELYKNNVTNFLVLEAKDYIGGRVKTESFDGRNISMGAAWIHNIQDKHEICQLANKYHLKYAKDNYDTEDMSIRHGGHGYLFNKWYVSWNSRVLKRSLDKCYTMIEEETDEVMNMSLRQCLREGGWNIRAYKRGRIREALDWLMFDFEMGARAEEVAAWQSSYTGEGSDVLVTDNRGYVYPLLQEIKTFHHKFMLNTEVRRVTMTIDNKYIVATNKGNYKAKDVVVSFSSGVLLAKKVKFQPELPTWKTEALQYVPMGHYCRYFFKFPYQVWENTTYIILANEPRGHFIHWQNMNQPHFYPGSNILLATLTGDICKEKEKVDDEAVIAELMKVIRIQKDNMNVPDPIEMKRSNWSSDPYTLGAYARQKPGITYNHYKALNHPSWRSLWFTGDYAHQELAGYTHGALEHGKSVGRKVVRSLKKHVLPSLEPEYDDKYGR